MSEPDPFYTRDELIAARGTAPTRGLYCEKCSTYIPQFADLSERNRDRILQLLREGRTWMAIEELTEVTGCDLGWAKVWINHKGKPEVVYDTPCPFCGVALRSSEAKQCRHCKRDWHDPNNILSLGTTQLYVEN